MPKFKVGQKIRATRATQGTHGRWFSVGDEVIVDGVEPITYDGDLTVRVGSDWLLGKHFEPVAPVFKEGDRVVKVAPHNAVRDGENDPNGRDVFAREAPIGERGKVIDAAHGRLRVKWDNGNTSSLAREVVALDETTPKTGRVTPRNLMDLKVGDVVVQDNGGDPWADVVVERVKPEPPKPTHGFGDAYVFDTRATLGDAQKRYRGFLSGAGNFYFLDDQGNQRKAWPSQFEDFHLED